MACWSGSHPTLSCRRPAPSHPRSRSHRLRGSLSGARSGRLSSARCGGLGPSRCPSSLRILLAGFLPLFAFSKAASFFVAPASQALCDPRTRSPLADCLAIIATITWGVLMPVNRLERMTVLFDSRRGRPAQCTPVGA